MGLTEEREERDVEGRGKEDDEGKGRGRIMSGGRKWKDKKEMVEREGEEQCSGKETEE